MMIETKQKIVSVEIADFDDEDTTISVTATAGNDREIFHVQTVDGEYRGDLGCWIFTDNIGDDIGCNDYKNFDLREVVAEAEYLASQAFTRTDYMIDGETAYLFEAAGACQVVTENRRFVNKDTSSYQRAFSDVIRVFNNSIDAISALNTLSFNS